MNSTINIERVYATPSGTPSDGFRVFIDRLWPRGESKEKFHYDLWAKDIAPSTDLREWYHADPQNRWQEFVRKYNRELAGNAYTPEFVRIISQHPFVTLLYSSHDEQRNNAIVLRDFLLNEV